MSSKFRYAFAVVASLLTCPLGAHPTLAQTPRSAIAPRVGVGYVVNAPNMFLGFSGFALTERFGGIGIYVDAKFDLETPEDDAAAFMPDLTVEQVESEFRDRLFRDDDVWNSFNAALLRPVTNELMLYLGAGLAEKDTYWQYYDPAEVRGVGGYYWVSNVEESGAQLNVLGGAMFRIGSNVFLQFGVESAAPGATVGALLSLPLK